ncbi:DUF6879 family protein [Nocardia sp. NPDC004860]|uniref:DUF6879 family protein n=1 Tax=Nocardia sp. NPDC004860 TaxID=3154557 RepID=UPI0033BD9B57
MAIGGRAFSGSAFNRLSPHLLSRLPSIGRAFGLQRTRALPGAVQAGEDVRYLPRHLIDSDELTTDDWWIFDDSVVAFTVFEPGDNGRWIGGAVTTDPRIVEYIRRRGRLTKRDRLPADTERY